MVIKTLEHIHKLLLNDERVAKGMSDFAREEKYKAQDRFNDDPSEKNKARLEEAKAECERLYEKWYLSHMVLDDFETQGF